MKFGPHRVQAFKEFFLISFCTYTVVAWIPEVVNYYIAWMQPVPTKEQILRWFWIVPLLSLFAATVLALLTKEEADSEKD